MVHPYCTYVTRILKQILDTTQKFMCKNFEYISVILFANKTTYSNSNFSKDAFWYWFLKIFQQFIKTSCHKLHTDPDIGLKHNFHYTENKYYSPITLK